MSIGLGFKPAFTVLLCVNLISGVATAGVKSPIYDPYSKTNLYIVGSNTSSWSQAEAEANALGGHLITIHSDEENQFVVKSVFRDFTSSGGPDLSNAVQLYIGLIDRIGAANAPETSDQHAANLVWVDGENASYRNWYAGEPNNGNGGPSEFYSAMWGPNGSSIAGVLQTVTGQWNDVAEVYTGEHGAVGFYGLAEVPIQKPLTFSLSNIGAARLAILAAIFLGIGLVAILAGMFQRRRRRDDPQS